MGIKVEGRFQRDGEGWREGGGETGRTAGEEEEK